MAILRWFKCHILSKHNYYNAGLSDWTGRTYCKCFYCSKITNLNVPNKDILIYCPCYPISHKEYYKEYTKAFINKLYEASLREEPEESPYIIIKSTNLLKFILDSNSEYEEHLQRRNSELEAIT